MSAASFAAKARANEPVVGYWVVLDSPVSTERVARLGYDYVALDAQHGLMGYSGWLHGLMAIDAAGAAGIVRVPSNNAAFIGQALDAGAAGVIVPLVNNAEEAAAAVRAVRYRRHGMRSAQLEAQGWKLPPSQGNFLWIRADESLQARLVDAFDRAGIMVRAYQGDGVRITVAGPAANNRVLRVLEAHAA
ncbi:MAG TPA: aldolase/citrate lyase family protein [Arthrobacter sp.]|nr:aldolase/citrate lyase family protein [Arthrobacter sp.]